MIARCSTAVPHGRDGGGAFMSRREYPQSISAARLFSIWLKADADIIMTQSEAPGRTARCCRPRIPPRPSAPDSRSATPVYRHADIHDLVARRAARKIVR